MKKLILAAIMVFAVAAFLMVSVTPSEAVHGGSGELTCGQCHTMHSSQGDDFTDMGTAFGSSLLLRISSTKKISDLCLSCHADDAGASASQEYNTAANWKTTPPKVLLNAGGWVSDFTLIGSGGDFSSVLTGAGGIYTPQDNDGQTSALGASLGYGHSVNNANDMTPPGGNSGGAATAIANFGCTNCHDPHGVDATTVDINLYRNLKSGLGDDPVTWTAGSTGDLASSYVGGYKGDAIDGSARTLVSNIWPVIMNTDPAKDNVYFTGAVNANMSRFCSQCHGDWHEALQTSNGAAGATDWSRHPVNLALRDGTGADQRSVNGTSIVDFDHYDASTSLGLQVGYKLPTMKTGAAGATYYATADTDKVFCLSCHFAHAGPNFDALRWSYQTTVTKGGQVGVSLASDIGCQQCHNRGGTYGI